MGQTIWPSSCDFVTFHICMCSYQVGLEALFLVWDFIQGPFCVCVSSEGLGKTRDSQAVSEPNAISTKPFKQKILI